MRIRVMTCDKRPEFLSFVGTAQEMLDENGLAYFWSGLGALLFRELPFAIAKVGHDVLWIFVFSSVAFRCVLHKCTLARFHDFELIRRCYRYTRYVVINS